MWMSFEKSPLYVLWKVFYVRSKVADECDLYHHVLYLFSYSVFSV